jgi:ATP-binding cassette subfamily F protein 3
VENGVITTFEGNYEDYLRKKEELAARAISGEVSSLNGDSSPSSKTRSFDKLRTGSGAPSPSPAEDVSQVSNGTTIVIEGGVDGAANNKPRRLNPIKQKQMEDRCAFLEDEIPRVEASIAHTEEQLGVFVSAVETQRLTELAAALRDQLGQLTAEWEELMLQLEGA